MSVVAKLSAQANRYEFSTSVSFRSWMHVSGTLLREARVYYAEGDLESAYMYYLRYLDLVLNRLRHHPQYSEYKVLYSPLVAEIPELLEEAENLKQMIETKHLDDESAASSSTHRKLKEKKQRGEYERQAYNLEDAVEHRGLDTLAYLRRTGKHGTKNQDLLLSTGTHPTAFTYPQPSVPAKSLSTMNSPSFSISFKKAVLPEKLWRVSPKSEVPSDVVHKVKHYTESGAELRTLFLPRGLREAFLHCAASNTDKNLETCGVLCGKLSRGAFFVTDIVIPLQESQPDSCSTLDEEALFEYVCSQDLFILGWVHTHPTQTCFMSSIDLHTQCAYQIMLPEAIAIVYAPRHHPDRGIFRLADPSGIDIIKQCHQTGFHSHDEPNLYFKALPGHCMEHDYKFTLKDMRPSLK